MSNGFLILRDGLVLSFFMRRPHREVSEPVLRALELYCHAVGPDKLSWYTNTEGELQPLDAEGWEYIHTQLRSTNGWPADLWESTHQVGGYRFEYRGLEIDSPRYARWTGVVCGVSFWLPTEYLEEQGPARVKELAMALARELPLSTGYVSPAFNTLTDESGIERVLRELCFRYPGMDIPDIGITMRIGTRPKGAYWLNFYGQPLLGELGGLESLRKQLSRSDISIQEVEGDKVLVELGEWPEIEGEMRSYRQLAYLLEPYLHEESLRSLGFSKEELRRWERRFLD